MQHFEGIDFAHWEKSVEREIHVDWREDQEGG